MNVEDFYNESEYSKIDFGSNPTLFTKKELLDFANEYMEAITVTPCCESDSEQLKYKKVISFGLWCDIKNIHHSFDDFYLWDTTLIEKESVLKMYQNFIQNL